MSNHLVSLVRRWEFDVAAAEAITSDQDHTLQTLELVSCHVHGPRPLELLAQSHQLSHGGLKINDCTGMSEEDVRAFIRARPDVQVEVVGCAWWPEPVDGGDGDGNE